VTADQPDYTISSRASAMRASEIRELLKLLDRPGMISFAGGIPDPSLFDLESFRAAYESALSENGAALQYSTSEGYPPLRRWIARRMSDLGVDCTEDNILVTHGSQQGLDLIGKLFLDPGSQLITEAPTYLGALQSFSACEPDFTTVRFRDGVAETNAAAARLIYLVTDFANPSGRTMTLEERDTALELAHRTGAVLVEDAAYTDLRYEGERIPAIAALDIAACGSIEAARTLYCGTFSKTLSPGLRVGWICGPAKLIRRLTLIKQAADLHTATINQQVLYRIAETGFDAAVERARAAYASRRDAMLAALRRHAPVGVTWTEPAGGLFIWVTLPDGADTAPLLEKTIERNVAFVPGTAFFADGSGKNTMRLSYSLLSEEVMEGGIRTLCGIIKEYLQTYPSSGTKVA
jgi:DNA-binding transcriptional MocR family regulator